MDSMYFPPAPPQPAPPSQSRANEQPLTEDEILFQKLARYFPEEDKAAIANKKRNLRTLTLALSCILFFTGVSLLYGVKPSNNISQGLEEAVGREIEAEGKWLQELFRFDGSSTTPNAGLLQRWAFAAATEKSKQLERQTSTPEHPCFKRTKEYCFLRAMVEKDIAINQALAAYNLVGAKEGRQAICEYNARGNCIPKYEVSKWQGLLLGQFDKIALTYAMWPNQFNFSADPYAENMLERQFLDARANRLSQQSRTIASEELRKLVEKKRQLDEIGTQP